MLYLEIDQHARQITISLRDENGDVVQARQVSTRPEKIQAFFAKLARERLREGESFVAVLEVCGFNDWLIQYNRHRPHSGRLPRQVRTRTQTGTIAENERRRHAQDDKHKCCPTHRR